MHKIMNLSRCDVHVNHISVEYIEQKIMTQKLPRKKNDHLWKYTRGRVEKLTSSFGSVLRIATRCRIRMAVETETNKFG